ncbi:MAG: rRNA maturation RNase YbeY [Eubacterium sp.]|nr:rRNA maturation RNase YbeY [Eubacterium sp.]
MYIDYTRNSSVRFDFDESELLETLVRETMKELECPFEVEVSVSIVDGEEIRGINNEFREIDSVTDVLSFPMNEFDVPGCFSGEVFSASKTLDPDTGELMLGDIVLCAEKVKSQAAEYGHSEKREYAFLIVHSLLHLSGYDHMTDDERQIMENYQRSILENLEILR